MAPKCNSAHIERRPNRTAPKCNVGQMERGPNVTAPTCKVTRGTSQNRSKEPSHNQSASPGSWLLRFPERPWGPGSSFCVTPTGGLGVRVRRGGVKSQILYGKCGPEAGSTFSCIRWQFGGPSGSSFSRVSRSRLGPIFGGFVGPPGAHFRGSVGAPRSAFLRMRGTKIDSKLAFKGSWDLIEARFRGFMGGADGSLSRVRGPLSELIFKGSWNKMV